MDIITIAKDLWKTKNLQVWMNNRFNDPKYYLLNKDVFKEVITKDELKFVIDENLIVWQNIWEEYWIDDIHNGDKVIDLGANIGVFSCIAAKRGAKVVSVEPFTTEQLKQSIRSNNCLGNVTVLESALGDGTTKEIMWQGEYRTMKTITFQKVKEISGGCDLLKCDIESFEWFLHYNDLKDIPKIEMELHKHNLDPKNNYYPRWLKPLQKSHNVVFNDAKIVKPSDNNFGVLHARLK